MDARAEVHESVPESAQVPDGAARAGMFSAFDAGLPAASAVLALQRSIGNRATAQLLRRPSLTPTLAVVPAVASATAQHIARCTGTHDGKRGCGPVRGAFETEDSETGEVSRFVIDRRIVLQGMPPVDPGTWVAQILSPPNPAKDGEKRGWVDGLKVDVGEALRGEVLEVKSRRSGGCCLASREADGYVTVLNAIAPQIQRVSELATAGGQGVRAPSGTSPSRVAELLSAAGIDVSTENMRYAWLFYNSLQNALNRTFTTPFTSVSFKVHAGGAPGQTYKLDPPMLAFCKDAKGLFFGIEEIVFQVNQRGGLSYGCEKKCDRNRERSEAENKAIANYEERKAGKTDAPRAEIMYEPEDDAQPMRPAAVTSLVPELQQNAIVKALNAGLWDKFHYEPRGRQFYLVASPQLVAELVGKPRAMRTTEMLKVRTPIALGARALNSQILFWFYGVPMSIAIIVATGGLAGELAGGAELAGGGALGTMLEGLTPATLQALGSGAANDNAIKVVAAAAGVILTLAIARPASASEGEWGIQDRWGVAARPVDELGAGHTIGDELQDGGVTHVVIGTAQAR